MDRDRGALHLVARMRMMTRPQLRRALFRERSDTVVKRVVDRLLEEGLLGASRYLQTGFQVLWCTTKGRDYLVDTGAFSDALFPARGPVAAKDFQHTLLVVEVAIALMRRGWLSEAIFPAWYVQRTFASALAAVPDLLVLSEASARQPASALAVEVDLGGESLTVLMPKLAQLTAWLSRFCGGAACGVLILTQGPRRKVSIERRIQAQGAALDTSVELLPNFLGGSDSDHKA
jgi:hypothetical protein